MNVCKLCGGPVRSDSEYGICRRNAACKKEQRHLKRVGQWWTCKLCGARMRSANQFGVCQRTPDCVRAYKRAWAKDKYASDAAYRSKQVDYTRENNPEQRALTRHGMTLAEYNEYLSHGCAISDCVREAEVIDHDHNVGCPAKYHSCQKCRRGPLCARHNKMSDAQLKELGYLLGENDD